MIGVRKPKSAPNVGTPTKSLPPVYCLYNTYFIVKKFFQTVKRT
ncbi:hypothetical protein LEP1GSC040_2337 [Leptospira santarosai str. 2000030832]|nr:hypothetical protein LEP1GSC040_2337 [Leptospira santarosai str. 2000030832]